MSRLIKQRTSLSTVLDEVQYSLSSLHAHPLTGAFVPAFQALRDEWKVVHDEEIAHLEAVTGAQARVDATDESADTFCSKLSKTLLTITHDDRTHSLYLHFFGDKSLSVFTRPVHGWQLDAMRKWSDSLAGSPYPALASLAPELAAVLGAADAALKDRDDAHQSTKIFRDLGARKQFIDRVNATRKTTHGELAKLAIEQPGLWSSFADRFFRRANVKADEAPTIASLTAEIAELAEAIEEKQELLAELQKEADEAAKAEEAQKAAAAELAELDKQALEIEKKKAELKKQLPKK